MKKIAWSRCTLARPVYSARSSSALCKKRHELSYVAQQCLELARRPAAHFDAPAVAAAGCMQVHGLEPTEQSQPAPDRRRLRQSTALERADGRARTAILHGCRGSRGLPQRQVRGDEAAPLTATLVRSLPIPSLVAVTTYVPAAGTVTM